MVCIYCGNRTSVINSRTQKQINQIWRRRLCEACGSIFSTQEGAQLTKALMLRSGRSLQPFSRDKLYLSIYESCRHRTDAINDASAITLNIIGRLNGFSATGEILRGELITLISEVLSNFDTTAAAVYSGLHTL